MHKIVFFPGKNICANTTIPKVFRPITRNTFIFLFGLMGSKSYKMYLLHVTKNLL